LVPLFVLALIVLGGAFGYYKLFGAIRSSEPYQMALAKVQKDTAVIAEVGEPIQDVFWPLPSAQDDRDRGEARMDFAVTGPKGKAHVHAEARRIADKWGLTRVEVTPVGGKRILLELGEESGLDAALPFQPSSPATDQKSDEPPPKMEFQIPER
jgi:hypothetical protein